MMARVNLQDYVEQKIGRASQKYKKKYWKHFWLVKEGKSGSGFFMIGKAYIGVPKELINQRVRLKLEVIPCPE